MINRELLSGLILFATAVVAITLSNSSYSLLYWHFLDVHFLFATLLHWINDGLMTIFFFTIGLELKREMQEGQLRDHRQLLLPAMAALGGVLLPIAIYTLINIQHNSLVGWAIPMATDIAFAVGMLSLVSRWVSQSMKLFLLTLAVVDDLLAIIVIAIFHSHGIAIIYLFFMVLVLGCLYFAKLRSVKSLWIYLLLGVCLWYSMLKAGIHPTLAGVIIGLFIPLHDANNRPLLTKLEHALQPWIIWFILPIFALANAGVDLTGFTITSLLQPVSLGIILGLALGKPCGIVLFTWVTGYFTRKVLPITYRELWVVGSFAGIAFTMGLFLANLSFANYPSMLSLARAGILAGSALSFILAIILSITLLKNK